MSNQNFNEAHARKLDRLLAERAIVTIVAMPEDEMAKFVDLFNRVFWHPQRGYVIMPRGETQTTEPAHV